MSSAAESPPGPRIASRSRGRSAGGRSRTDRRVRRCGCASADGCVVERHDPPAGPGRGAGHVGTRRPRGPNDGSPPISPAVRTRERPEDYGGVLTGGSPRASRSLGAPRDPASRPAGRRRTPGYRASALPATNSSSTWIPLKAPVQADRGIQRPAGEEQPAEGHGDREQRDEREDALAARRPRTRRRTGEHVGDGEEHGPTDDRRPRGARGIVPRPSSRSRGRRAPRRSARGPLPSRG